jgi:hypothetical protein
MKSLLFIRSSHALEALGYVENALQGTRELLEKQRIACTQYLKQRMADESASLNASHKPEVHGEVPGYLHTCVYRLFYVLTQRSQAIPFVECDLLVLECECLLLQAVLLLCLERVVNAALAMRCTARCLKLLNAYSLMCTDTDAADSGVVIESTMTTPKCCVWGNLLHRLRCVVGVLHSCVAMAPASKLLVCLATYSV